MEPREELNIKEQLQLDVLQDAVLAIEELKQKRRAAIDKSEIDNKIRNVFAFIDGWLKSKMVMSDFSLNPQALFELMQTLSKFCVGGLGNAFEAMRKLLNKNEYREEISNLIKSNEEAFHDDVVYNLIFVLFIDNNINPERKQYAINRQNLAIAILEKLIDLYPPFKDLLNVYISMDNISILRELLKAAPLKDDKKDDIKLKHMYVWVQFEALGEKMKQNKESFEADIISPIINHIMTRLNLHFGTEKKVVDDLNITGRYIKLLEFILKKDEDKLFRPVISHLLSTLESYSHVKEVSNLISYLCSSYPGSGPKASAPSKLEKVDIKAPTKLESVILSPITSSPDVNIQNLGDLLKDPLSKDDQKEIERLELIAELLKKFYTLKEEMNKNADYVRFHIIYPILERIHASLNSHFIKEQDRFKFDLRADSITTRYINILKVLLNANQKFKMKISTPVSNPLYSNPSVLLYQNCNVVEIHQLIQFLHEKTNILEEINPEESTFTLLKNAQETTKLSITVRLVMSYRFSLLLEILNKRPDLVIDPTRTTYSDGFTIVDVLNDKRQEIAEISRKPEAQPYQDYYKNHLQEIDACLTIINKRYQELQKSVAIQWKQPSKPSKLETVNLTKVAQPTQTIEKDFEKLMPNTTCQQQAPLKKNLKCTITFGKGIEASEMRKKVKLIFDKHCSSSLNPKSEDTTMTEESGATQTTYTLVLQGTEGALRAALKNKKLTGEINSLYPTTNAPNVQNTVEKSDATPSTSGGSTLNAPKELSTDQQNQWQVALQTIVGINEIEFTWKDKVKANVKDAEKKDEVGGKDVAGHFVMTMKETSNWTGANNPQGKPIGRREVFETVSSRLGYLERNKDNIVYAKTIIKDENIMTITPYDFNLPDSIRKAVQNQISGDFTNYVDTIKTENKKTSTKKKKNRLKKAKNIISAIIELPALEEVVEVGKPVTIHAGNVQTFIDICQKDFPTNLSQVVFTELKVKETSVERSVKHIYHSRSTTIKIDNDTVVSTEGFLDALEETLNSEHSAYCNTNYKGKPPKEQPKEDKPRTKKAKSKTQQKGDEKVRQTEEQPTTLTLKFPIIIRSKSDFQKRLKANCIKRKLIVTGELDTEHPRTAARIEEKVPEITNTGELSGDRLKNVRYYYEQIQSISLNFMKEAGDALDTERRELQTVLVHYYLMRLYETLAGCMTDTEFKYTWNDWRNLARHYFNEVGVKTFTQELTFVNTNQLFTDVSNFSLNLQSTATKLKDRYDTELRDKYSEIKDYSKKTVSQPLLDEYERLLKNLEKNCHGLSQAHYRDIWLMLQANIYRNQLRLGEAPIDINSVIPKLYVALGHEGIDEPHEKYNNNLAAKAGLVLPHLSNQPGGGFAVNLG